MTGVDMTSEEFRKLFDTVSNWGRWVAKDYIGVDCHNEGHSHIDALCHVAFDGSLFDGEPAGSVTAQGAQVGGIEVLKDGLVGRAVLLDVPRVRGARWIEPGEHVFPEDLVAAEREDVMPHCEATGRWGFLFVAAPLRITGGTGSPLNAIAIF